MKNRRQKYGSNVYEDPYGLMNEFYKLNSTKDFDFKIAKKGRNPGTVGFLVDPQGYLSDIRVLQNPNSKHSNANKYRSDTEMDLKEMSWRYTPKQLETLAKKGRLYTNLRSGSRKKEYDDNVFAEREKAKKNGNYDRQINTTKSKSSDDKRLAKAPGKRTSVNGKTYYERRSNRSDTLSERSSYKQRNRGYY